MKNYYEILEVDKNASQEVIEKAYKTLAKKYHPDLQQGVQQKEYAEKMKKINEAYEILSDNFKREQYNQELNKTANTVQQKQVDDGTIINMSRILEQQIRNAQRQAYHDAYIQDLKSRGYKIKYKHDLKYYIKLIKVLAITILACFLIYQIPIVKEFFQNLYKENMVFQAIVDIFKNTFSVKF